MRISILVPKIEMCKYQNETGMGSIHQKPANNLVTHSNEKTIFYPYRITSGGQGKLSFGHTLLHCKMITRTNAMNITETIEKSKMFGLAIWF